MSKKYKLSTDEKEELTKIALHDGWDKAFHKLMEIAIEDDYIDDKADSEKIVARFFEKVNVDLHSYIVDFTRFVSEYFREEDDEKASSIYDKFCCKITSYSHDTDYLKMTEALLNFNFQRVSSYLSKERDFGIIEMANIIKNAIYAICMAIDSYDGRGTWYRIDNWFAIITPDEDTYFLKLIYSLEESTTEF